MMNRLFSIVSLVFILLQAVTAGSLLPASLAGQAESETVARSNSGVRLLTSAQSGLVLELTTPNYDVAVETLPAVGQAHHDAGPFQRLTVAEYGVTGQAGKPQVPIASALLGVPPNAEIELRFLAEDAAPLPGRYRYLAKVQ